jgi:peptidoglycan/LPS O-acetylase OafA/YrhL
MVNAPLWSLRYEVVCYGLVALVGWVAVRAWGAAVAATFAACWTIALVEPPIGAVPMALARLGACFTAGMLFYAWRDRIPYHPALAAVAAAVLLATFLTSGFRLAFPIAGAYLLFFVAFARGAGVAGFARYGDFSYGLYVLGYPIQQTLVHSLGPDHSVAFYFVTAFALTLVLAAASWHLVEAPALARKPRPSHRVAP